MHALGPDSKVVVRLAAPSAGGHAVVPMAGSPGVAATVEDDAADRASLILRGEGGRHVETDAR